MTEYQADPQAGFQDDPWLGAVIEAQADNLDIPGGSLRLDLEIPEDEHDGEPPAVA